MKSIYLISTAALAVIAATPAAAQDDAQNPTPPSGAARQSQSTDEEGAIIVTAQRREQRLQDVPIAVSAFTNEALQERAVSDVAQLSNLSPNVTLDGGTPFSASSSVLSAYIRGIGANDFAFNIDPGVGIYLDGVYLARTVGADQDISTSSGSRCFAGRRAPCSAATRSAARSTSSLARPATIS